MEQTRDAIKREEYRVKPVDPADMNALKAIEEVQAEVWEMRAEEEAGELRCEKEREIVPSHVLEIVAETGGQLLAARTNDDDKIIGFALAFLAKNDGPHKHPGIPDGELFLASHMVGVLPLFQSSGVGYAIKKVQKEHALRRDLRWMQWTYYPMFGKNAALNLRKLGARCHRFVRNKYGEQTSGLYAGLPSDRLVVVWDMQHDEAREFPQESTSLTRVDDDGRPVLNESALSDAAAGGGPYSVTCSIPREFEQLRQRDLEAARAWQETFAQVATALFSSQAGWAITNFRLREDNQVGEYLFARV